MKYLLSLLLISSTALANEKVVIVDLNLQPTSLDEVKNITHEVKELVLEASKQDPAIIYLTNIKDVLRTADPARPSLSMGFLWGLKGQLDGYCVVMNTESEPSGKRLNEQHRAIMINTTVVIYKMSIFTQNYSNDCPLPTQGVVYEVSVPGERSPKLFSSSAVSLKRNGDKFVVVYHYGNEEALNTIRRNHKEAEIVSFATLSAIGNLVKNNEVLEIEKKDIQLSKFKGYLLTLP